MYSQPIILAVAGLVTSTLAQSTSTISIPCLAAGGNLIASIPEPRNTNLINAIATLSATIPPQASTSPCAAVTSIASAVPTSLYGDLASYQAQLASYFSVHSADLSSAYALCRTLPATVTTAGFRFSPAEAVEVLNVFTALADTGCVRVAGATGAGAATATTTADAKASGANIPTAAAPAAARPTGLMAGAAVAAGFVGVAALL
ncbi:hypothetical protein M426DRAFT_9679 [Hypoxylon sp. CI-4A]|nr:hypothetical protein M426DRAFT_9679 [Hypoxylon sp. CI-4A]